MRRERQALEQEEVEQILKSGTSGVLSLVDEEGYPYAVPLSYVWYRGKIYFHSAKAGHKVSAVKHCDRASFCIVARDDVQPQRFTTFYQSVIAFGKISVVQDAEEERAAIEALGEKYYPDHEQELQAEIERFRSAFIILALEIERITGKQAKELIKKR